MYEGVEPCGRSPLTVTSENTYLANSVTKKSGRGSSSCPWHIRVSYGQTVNVTLLDFAAQTTEPTAHDQGTTCHIYAEMYVNSVTERTTICSRGDRRRVLHSHTGRQDIRIAITRDVSSDFYFLLHVQGSSFICAAQQLALLSLSLAILATCS